MSNIPVNQSEEELFPLVDIEGNVIGKATRKHCHSLTFVLHPVVHLHVFNTIGELFLQKRPEWKDVQPGKWDTAVGGHVDYGETPEKALIREAYEEVGLDEDDYTPIFVSRYDFRSKTEYELVNVFKCITDVTPKPSDETDGGRFFSREEILSLMGKEFFTPNFEEEWKKLFYVEQ